ncbi:uncharacterized protein J3D65DRAFT_631789 [Phyllosticta citribraziliensis]|uniref:Uncharacterized protein n=1 Tax=Phyllosticta citribraziliensis TaxID=989973 RepID=A0ABR1LFC4_9PEZI
MTGAWSTISEEMLESAGWALETNDWISKESVCSGSEMGVGSTGSEEKSSVSLLTSSLVSAGGSGTVSFKGLQDARSTSLLTMANLCPLGKVTRKTSGSGTRSSHTASSFKNLLTLGKSAFRMTAEGKPGKKEPVAQAFWKKCSRLLGPTPPNLSRVLFPIAETQAFVKWRCSSPMRVSFVKSWTLRRAAMPKTSDIFAK